MSMDELVEETGYSKSTVSSNMSPLESLGLAKRVIIQGDKRYHYIPGYGSRFSEEGYDNKQKEEMQIIMAALDRTEKDLLASEHDSRATLERIEGVRHFYLQTDKLLDLISLYNTVELIELLQQIEKKQPNNWGIHQSSSLIDSLIFSSIFFLNENRVLLPLSSSSSPKRMP